MAILTNATLIFVGAIGGLENDVLTTPFIAVDDSLKKVDATPIGDTLQDYITQKVNENLGSDAQVSGVTGDFRGSYVNVSIDLHQLMVDAYSNNVQEAIDVVSAFFRVFDKVALSVVEDENGRPVFTPINEAELTEEIKIIGDVDFDANGSPIMSMTSIEIVDPDDSTKTITYTA